MEHSSCPAFLFSSNMARPFWYTAVLGPRFLASAFCSGPALIILALQAIDRFSAFKVAPKVIDTLALIATVSLQINLVLLGVEIFTDFYNPPEHTASAVYLYTGLKGYNALVPWIWTAISFSLTAVVILTVHGFRRTRWLLNIACVLLIVGVWIEKGMGLVVPGFIPTPIGEIFEYTPSTVEILVSLGIWAFGIILFAFLAKVTIGIELGQIKFQPGSGPAAAQT